MSSQWFFDTGYCKCQTSGFLIQDIVNLKPVVFYTGYCKCQTSGFLIQDIVNVKPVVF